MAIAKKYSLKVDAISGKTKKYISSLKGQAKVVFSELEKNQTPRLAKEISSTCPNFETRQDKYRVVLYYILVFKAKGIISSVEDTDKDEKIPENIWPDLPVVSGVPGEILE